VHTLKAILLLWLPWVCFISVENRGGGPVGVFMICGGQDLDIDVTSTKTPRKWRSDTRESGMSIWQKNNAVSVKSCERHST
jgi:hypothetical protein